MSRELLSPRSSKSTANSTSWWPWFCCAAPSPMHSSCCGLVLMLIGILKIVNNKYTQTKFNRKEHPMQAIKIKCQELSLIQLTKICIYIQFKIMKIIPIANHLLMQIINSFANQLWLQNNSQNKWVLIFVSNEFKNIKSF